MRDLSDIRREIDAADETICRAVSARFALTDEVGACKAATGVPVLNEERERCVLKKAAEKVAPPYDVTAEAVMQALMDASRVRQYRHSAEKEKPVQLAERVVLSFTLPADSPAIGSVIGELLACGMAVCRIESRLAPAEHSVLYRLHLQISDGTILLSAVRDLSARPLSFTFLGISPED